MSIGNVWAKTREFISCEMLNVNFQEIITKILFSVFSCNH